jgi:hypothetical protein
MTYGNYEELENNGIIFEPLFDANADLEGVTAVNFLIDSASATAIDFYASTCEGVSVAQIAETDLKFLSAVDGNEQQISVTENSTTGLYTITGVGEDLVSGVLTLDGIVTIATINYSSGFTEVVI